MKKILLVISFCLVASIAISLASKVQAFEVDWFRSGMTKEEVEKQLKGMGFNKIDIEERSILARDIPDTATSRFYQFVFKNDKLISLHKSFPHSVNNFIFLFDKLTSLYGKPVSSTPHILLSSTGEIRLIRFNFFKYLSEPNTFNSVTEVIALSLVGESPNPSLSVTYQAGPLND